MRRLVSAVAITSLVVVTGCGGGSSPSAPTNAEALACVKGDGFHLVRDVLPAPSGADFGHVEKNVTVSGGVSLYFYPSVADASKGMAGQDGLKGVQAFAARSGGSAERFGTVVADGLGSSRATMNAVRRCFT
jgi:hypothetical protein